MKRRFTILLTVLLALFVANQLLERFTNIQVPFLYSYLDDLLVVPVSLGLFRLIRTHKNNLLGLPLSIVIVCIVGLSFHFEVLMPWLSEKYTKDAWDVVMYAIGGGGYLLFMNGVRWDIILKGDGQSPVVTRD